MDLTSLYEFVERHGVLVGVLVLGVALIVYLLRLVMDEDKAALFRARVYRCMLFLSRRRVYEKKYIANDIRGRLNLARKRLYYGRAILPKAVRVEWVDGAEPSSYEIGEGRFVVRLDPASQQERNVVHLAEAVVERTSLSGIRHLVVQPLCAALDMTLVKRLLQAGGGARTLDWFYANVYRPLVEGGGQFAEWNAEVVAIDEQGLFNTLLLVELEDFSKRIAGMDPQPYMVGEVEHLVHFVHAIATKQEGVDVPLGYRRAHLRVGVVLVARADTILREGIEPYVHAAKEFAARQAVNTLYLIVWGKRYLTRTRPDDFLRYVARWHELVSAIGRLPGFARHFGPVKYSYISPDGSRTVGRLTRFVVEPRQASLCELGYGPYE